jgi:hypothetical protein
MLLRVESMFRLGLLVIFKLFHYWLSVLIVKETRVPDTDCISRCKYHYHTIMAAQSNGVVCLFSSAKTLIRDNLCRQLCVYSKVKVIYGQILLIFEWILINRKHL